MQAVSKVGVHLFDGLNDRLFKVLVQFLAHKRDLHRDGADTTVVNDLGFSVIHLMPTRDSVTL